MTSLRFMSALLLLIAVSLGAPAFAQTAAQDSVKTDKLHQLMQAMQMDMLHKTMIASIITQMDDQIARKWPDSAQQEKARAIFREEMEIMGNEVLQAAIDLMAPHYTVAELDQILAFYKSPVGQKAVRVNMTLMQDFGPMVTKHATNATAQLHRRWATEVK